MFKIGHFAKLGQVSVKTLRWYDELGLLKPMRIDSENGYRHYSIEQLPRLNRILALKELGLSLEQIVMLLKEDLPADQAARHAEAQAGRATTAHRGGASAPAAGGCALATNR